ncbi:methyltransferase-UbiE family protein [Biscogniauxia marginata]|nr:methyltransferase-UbiE family protein [Biscogniauxia marginata]
MDQYKQYNDAMLQSYSARTASELSAYMLERVRPGMQILDVGCGPGSITTDLATHVLQDGHVVGLDCNEDAIVAAQELARDRNTPNVRFVVGDVLNLPFADGAFDIVHAHQVLGHLPSGDGEPGPVRGLREMRRVCKPGGLVCAREAEWSSAVVHPKIPGLRETWDLMEKLSYNKGTLLSGGRIREFARRAGFPRENIWASAAAVTYTNPTGREWWGDNMARRLEASESQAKGVELGLVSKEEYAAMIAAWRAWAKHEDGFYSMIDGQIICTK